MGNACHVVHHVLGTLRTLVIVLAAAKPYQTILSEEVSVPLLLAHCLILT